MDSSSLGRRTPSSATRLSQYDEAGALACTRRRSDVTRCNGIDRRAFVYVASSYVNEDEFNT